MLDPNTNMLSPTRIQAWAATIMSFAAIVHDVAAPVASFAQASTDSLSTIVAAVWAHFAHKTYNEGKRINKLPNPPSGG